MCCDAISRSAGRGGQVDDARQVQGHEEVRACKIAGGIDHPRIENLHIDNDLKRIFQRHVDG
jgi:hypothetical protein